MSHFARINILTKKVDKVLSVEEDYIDSLPDYDLWIKTSYNTFGGEHRLGKTPLRKNFAQVGFTYDIERDAFIPSQPHLSWILNEDTCLWECPVEYPANADKPLSWNEENQTWDLIDGN